MTVYATGPRTLIKVAKYRLYGSKWSKVSQSNIRNVLEVARNVFKIVLLYSV